MKKIVRLFALSTVAGLASCGVKQDAELSQTKAVEPYEDCVSINYATAHVQNMGGSWKIVDGAHIAFDFGPHFGEAQKALQVIKNGHVRYSCFVKRPNPTFKYLLDGAGNAIHGNLLASEDCISFNPGATSVQLVAGRWKLVQGAMQMLDFGPGIQAKNQAQTTRAIIVSKNFSQQCFIGRPNPSFSYWKKVVLTPPTPLPSVNVTKSSCSDHVASAGSLFQCPANQVAVGLFDNIAPQGQFETVRCCSLQAGVASVSRVGAVSTYLLSGAGSIASCPGNTFMTGVSFNSAGSMTGISCQSLSSLGHPVVKFGAASQRALYNGAGDACLNQSIGTGVSDTISVDGVVDTLRCQSARRN